MNQHTALGLNGRHEGDTDEVGGESRPRRVGDGQDGGLPRIGVNLVRTLAVHNQIVVHLLNVHSHLAERVWNQSEMLASTVLDGDFRLRHGGHTDKAAYLDHVGENAVFASVQFLHSFDFQKIRTNTRNLCAHIIQHGAQLIQVRLARGVEDGGLALRKHGSHHNVGSTCHGRFVQLHVAAF